nr:YetF domain-containing protein [Streptacidiphilus carbonis]
MNHDLWAVQIPILEKIIRTVLVYALVLVLFRVAGKRGLANLNTFDFVVMFLLSNVVQNAVIGADNSLLGGVIGAVTLVAVNAAMNRWAASDPRAERLLEGTATTLITDGSFVPGALRRLALRTSEIEHAVRVQNGDSVEEVADARLEPGGQLIVTLKETDQTATHGDVVAIQARLAAIEELLTALAAKDRKHL